MNKERMYDGMVEEVSFVINAQHINACLFTRADVSFHAKMLVRYIHLY